MAEPLTKRRAGNGKAYTRRDEVEAEIDALLTLTPQERLARAKIDPGRAGAVSDEALLHLVRAAMRQKADRDRDALAGLLFYRCQARLKRAMPDQRFANAHELRGETLGVFCERLASDGVGKNPDQLDYYEVNFADAFKKLRSEVRRRQDRAFGRDVQLPEDVETDGEEPLRKDHVTRRADDLTTVAALQESLLHAKDLARLLEPLSENERTAVVLLAMGYQQASDDPDEATIATKCGVTRRTVYNWLKNAARKLGLEAKEDA